jgi:hypothetical protein
VLHEEASGTLLCGDIFTQLGDGPALTGGDVVGPAVAAEDLFGFSSLNPGMGATIRRLAGLAPRTLALMHGPSFAGDGAAALRALADDYDRRVLGRARRQPGRGGLTASRPHGPAATRRAAEQRRRPAHERGAARPVRAAAAGRIRTAAKRHEGPKAGAGSALVRAMADDGSTVGGLRPGDRLVLACLCGAVTTLARGDLFLLLGSDAPLDMIGLNFRATRMQRKWALVHGGR